MYKGKTYLNYYKNSEDLKQALDRLKESAEELNQRRNSCLHELDEIEQEQKRVDRLIKEGNDLLRTKFSQSSTVLTQKGVKE